MIKRANEAQQNLTVLLNKNNIFTLLPSYLAIGKVLITYSIDLMNTGAPLSKKAYFEAVEKLHQIKHDYLPRLIAELEQIEENTGFQLSKPALQQMDAYYVLLALLKLRR